MSKPLEQKIVRPGSLGNYSFYYSSRSNPEPVKTYSGVSFKKIAGIFIIFGAIFFGLQHFRSDVPVTTSASHQAVAKIAANKPTATIAAAPQTVNECASNTEPKFIIVSISQRKLWACEADKSVYGSAVITGMEKYPSTTTPPGTYTISAKTQNTVLTGSDQTGSWRDPVSYWMPFLDNQYGTYGFHDATWRSPDEFGKIDPATADNASHGCVELPIGTAAWLYNWAEVGTNLTIKA